jgi:glycosyltransferase involved in cell wall biosynthesis
MNVPAVSFVVTAYRHAKYVVEAVESCLRQTVREIEVIVVDDGSRDGTVEKLRGIDDERLVVLEQENRGPSLAANRGIAAARGQFIALMSGDDVCLPDRLRLQLATAEGGSFDAVFGRPFLIDEEGASLAETRLPEFFEQAASEDSAELFRALFFRRNFLCAPTALVRRSTFAERGAFHPALYQLQDFALWLQFCAADRVCLTDDRVACYRIRDGEANLSSSRQEARTSTELGWIYRHLYDRLDAALIRDAFGTELLRWGFKSADVDAQRLLLFLLHSDATVRKIALEHLLDRFGDAEKTERIKVGDLELRATDVARFLSAVA